MDICIFVSMNTSDKIILLLKKQHPNLKIIGKYINCETKILCEDKFGEIFLNIKYHIKKGNNPTINSALNKSTYWVNYIKDKYNYDYDYSKTIYISSKKKVIITCKKHGDFKVTPNDHDNKKSNCPKCKSEKQSIKKTLNTNDFIKNANKKHSNKYSYEKTIYKGIRSSLIVKCPIHGEFTTNAYKHLNTCGCDKCGKLLNKGIHCIKLAKKNINLYKNISAKVYLIKCFNNDEEFIKIGITTNNIIDRIYAIPYKCKIIEEINTNLFYAILIENLIFKKNIENKYIPKIKFGGHTECFIINTIKTIKNYE